MQDEGEAPVDNVGNGLLAVERALRQLGYWERESPPPEALQSNQPFAVDTLAFTQWLQFIFLPEMKNRLQQGQPLPAVSGIAPMAEEFFRTQAVTGETLITALRQMDALLSR